MASANRVILLGNLTKDPELRYTNSGVAVTDLRLAVNRVQYQKDGQRKESTDFIPIVVFAKSAEAAATYLRKGSPVFVEGRLQTREWTANDGQKRSVLEVVADRVEFLGRPAAAAPTDAPSGDAKDEVPF